MALISKGKKTMTIADIDSLVQVLIITVIVLLAICFKIGD